MNMPPDSVIGSTIPCCSAVFQQYARAPMIARLNLKTLGGKRNLGQTGTQPRLRLNIRGAQPSSFKHLEGVIDPQLSLQEISNFGHKIEAVPYLQQLKVL